MKIDFEPNGYGIVSKDLFDSISLGKAGRHEDDGVIHVLYDGVIFITLCMNGVSQKILV